MKKSAHNPEHRGPEALPTRADEALRWATHMLKSITDRPHLEAELLLTYHLDCRRIHLLAHPEQRMSPDQARRFAADVHRRVSGEPLPYLRGEIEFFGLDFRVTPDVLIPRPETEQLVELGRDWLNAHPGSLGIDVGTGSGCIAVALASMVPNARLGASDRSLKALRVAQTNASRHGVRGRITFWVGDLLQPIHGPVGLILSNPPYIAETAWHTLPPSVQREPKMALLSGPAGLNAIRSLLAQAVARLGRPGAAFIEIGEQQGAAARVLARAAFKSADIAILPDLAGKDRVLQIIQRR